MRWQPRRRLPLFSPAAAIALLTIAALCAHHYARAADPHDVAPAALSTCPDPDVVWAMSAGFVPSASSELLAARPGVEISDLGPQYRVRVARPGGTLERVYSDPARDCGKRARFVAEFILLALMPPHLAAEPEASAPRVIATPAAPAARDESGSRIRTPVLRIELAAVGSAAPSILSSPSVLAWGVDLRVCMGSGPFAAVAGAGYAPNASFELPDLRGSVTRVPAIVGVRARASRAQFEFAGDLAVAVAFERYSGTSPKTPHDATRVAPGVEADFLVSTGSLFHLAPFAGLRCSFAPVTNGLGATPQGVLGNTPSLWIGAALGLSLAL